MKPRSAIQNFRFAMALPVAAVGTADTSPENFLQGKSVSIFRHFGFHVPRRSIFYAQFREHDKDSRTERERNKVHALRQTATNQQIHTDNGNSRNIAFLPENVLPFHFRSHTSRQKEKIVSVWNFYGFFISKKRISQECSKMIQKCNRRHDLDFGFSVFIFELK